MFMHVCGVHMCACVWLVCISGKCGVPVGWRDGRTSLVLDC